jgi:hypothetical protein
MFRFKVWFVLTSLMCLASSRGQAPLAINDPPNVAGPMGATFTTVYFRKGNVSPHVGIKVSFSRLYETVLDYWGTTVVPADLKKKLAEVVSHPGMWILAGSSGECLCPGTIEAIDRIVPTNDVILGLEADYSFNSQYYVAFRLGEFRRLLTDGTQPVNWKPCGKESPTRSREKWCHKRDGKCLGLQNPIGLLLFHGEKQSPKKVRYSSRSAFELGGTGIPAKVTLITSDDVGGERVFRTDEARRYDVTYSLSGASRVVNEILGQAYSDLTIKARLSDQPLDQQSTVSVGIKSILAPFVLGSPFSGIFSAKLVTSQNMRWNSLVIGYGWRLGDIRAQDRRPEEDEPSFGIVSDATKRQPIWVPYAGIRDSAYFELALEAGPTYFMRVEDVPRELRETLWNGRVRLTLGFVEVKGNLWNVSGEVSGFYLWPGWSGALDESSHWAQSINLTLALKASDSDSIAVTWSAGRNPDARFVEEAPKLTLKAIRKF